MLVSGIEQPSAQLAIARERPFGRVLNIPFFTPDLTSHQSNMNTVKRHFDIVLNEMERTRRTRGKYKIKVHFQAVRRFYKSSAAYDSYFTLFVRTYVSRIFEAMEEK